MIQNTTLQDADNTQSLQNSQAHLQVAGCVRHLTINYSVIWNCERL